MLASSSSPVPCSSVPSPSLEHDIKKYLVLVHQTVACFLRKLPPNVLRDDLIAAGTYGLMDSLRRNEHVGNASFECYVRIRIRGAIVDELRAQDWLPRRTRWAASGKVEQRSGSPVPSCIVGFDDVPAADWGLSLADECIPSPADAVEAAYERDALSQAVNKLPDRERSIVRMHYFSGIKFKEIGATLGVSEPRVSQLHARAMARLRDILGEQDAAA